MSVQAFVESGAAAAGLSVCSRGAFSTTSACPTRTQTPCSMPPAPAAGRVSMNLADRFLRVVRANVNKVVTGMEDPEKILDQTVSDMQGDVVKVRQAYAEVAAGLKRLERQSEQASVTSDEWKKRAELALRKGEEDLAREALTRKKAADDQKNALAGQIDAMRANTEKLYESMQQLEGKINEARSKKDEYVARARTAKTSQKVNDMLGNVTDTGSMAAFDRMKTKVEEMEVKAEVSKDMAIGGAADTSLEGKFKALESDSVDDELAKMKGALGAGKSSMSLPQRSSNPEIDDELEKMKRSM